MLLAGSIDAGEFEYRHANSRILRSANGELVVEVMDPAKPINYLDRRFSSMALVLQAKYRGRSFLYSTEAVGAGHDYRGGAPMEFDLGERGAPPGYDAAAPGEPFLKVGVGLLRKHENSRYAFWHAYEVVEAAGTSVVWEAAAAVFTQSLNGNADGLSYGLVVKLSLEGNRLVFDYVLTNTGAKSFRTEQYLHNFSCFDREKLSSEYAIAFPYAYIPVNAANEPLAEPLAAPFQQQGRILTFNTARASGGKAWLVAPEDFTGANQLEVSHRNGQRMIIDASLPCTNIAVWVSDEQLSPEMNIVLHLEQGESVRFSRSYSFIVE